MNQVDAIPLLFLGLQGLALGLSFLILGWLLARHRWQRPAPPAALPEHRFFPFQPVTVRRPGCWLAIRAATPEAVKLTLGLNRAAPCTWAEGLAGEHEFFISPQVHGWVIVTGMALPNPSDDVDATFLFLTALSKQLGHVQYFYASRRLHHHAWARLDDGCVTRAYAWAGETVWNQGGVTVPEIEVDMRLLAYGEPATSQREVDTNFEKVPQLAARWSLDPAEVKLHTLAATKGIAGESAFP